MKYFALIFAAFLLLPHSVHAESLPLSISVYQDNAVQTTFTPFGDDYRGSGDIAVADLGNDGVEEILASPGPGLPPYVKVFRQDGSFIGEFLAYAETYQSGVTVTSCDLDGDNINEIVTGTMTGGGPHVRIFSSMGEPLYNGGFFAYATDFRGGVQVACGDIDGNGVNEIITAPGITGGPHVKVFSPTGDMQTEIFTGSATENTGASLALVDVDADGDKEIVTGKVGIGEPYMFVVDADDGNLNIMNIFHADESLVYGVSLSAVKNPSDGTEHIVVSSRKTEAGESFIYDATGTEISTINKGITGEAQHTIFAFTDQVNGTHVSMTSVAKSTHELGKYILVDVSDQTLYAYENGALVNSFLVSTGTYSYPTPLGKTEVTDKLLWHDYVWSYGANNPNNYALSDVKYNLRFRTHYYIHSAYWHNNFGNRMSHGCVNVAYDNAEWVYNWAEVGTPVEIVE